MFQFDNIIPNIDFTSLVRQMNKSKVYNEVLEILNTIPYVDYLKQVYYGEKVGRADLKAWKADQPRERPPAAAARVYL